MATAVLVWAGGWTTETLRGPFQPLFLSFCTFVQYFTLAHSNNLSVLDFFILNISSLPEAVCHQPQTWHLRVWTLAQFVVRCVCSQTNGGKHYIIGVCQKPRSVSRMAKWNTRPLGAPAASGCCPAPSRYPVLGHWCFFLKVFSQLSALHSHAGRQGHHFSSELKALMLTDLWGFVFFYCYRKYLDLFLTVAGFPRQSLWNISFYSDSLLSRAQLPCLLYWGYSGTTEQPNFRFDCTAAQKGVGTLRYLHKTTS